MKQEWIDAFFESLHLHKKYVMQAGLIVGGIPMERLFNHDASKFTEAEYPHYARQFFGDKGDPYGFALAWLNHIHQNDHHWQHFIFPDGYAPEGSRSLAGVMPMTEVATREMVADWMGASFGYTGSWDMTDWLGKHLTLRQSSPRQARDATGEPTGKIKLHPETEKILYDVLYSIGYRETDNSPLMALYDWSKYPK